jgi:hypothetical protein
VETEVIAWIPALPTVSGAEPAGRGETGSATVVPPARPLTAAGPGPVVPVSVSVAATVGGGVVRPTNPHAHPCEAEGIAFPRAGGGVVRAAGEEPAPVSSPAPITPAAARKGSSRHPLAAPRFPSGSIVLLALMSTVVWGLAWRNELLRLEAQRRGPDRLALEPSAGPAATRSIRP